MNPLEQLLQDDLSRLVDRIATTTAKGLVMDNLTQGSMLVARLGEAEARVSGLRLDLLGAYVAWRQALQECGDLWALAALSAEPATLAEARAA
jgi:hypothetical protein